MAHGDARLHRPFERDRHLRYFSHALHGLPGAYAGLDTNRLTLVHFAVQSLDLLGVWDDDDLVAKYHLNKQIIIDWVYSLQLVGKSRGEHDKVNGGRTAGFKGGTYLGIPFRPRRRHNEADGDKETMKYDHHHAAMTYAALCVLAALGDDLSGVDAKGIVRGLRELQLDDGSFRCVPAGSENDLRFLYCACAISSMLNDFSGIDADRAVNFVRRCRSYDGALSLIPGQEGHGGSTFCGVASLALLGRLDELMAENGWRDQLIGWCVRRQKGGMQGRPNKDEDTCYSFWIGGTLRLLGQDALLDGDELRRYVLSCQSGVGGFGKTVGVYPDLLHSFYSVAWLSLSNGSSSYSEGLPTTSLSTVGEVKGGSEAAVVPDDHASVSKDEGLLMLLELDCALGIRLERVSIFRDAFQ